MIHLITCPVCDRHVRVTDPICPFCGDPLPMSLRASRPRLPTERLGRAATMMFGATLAASAGCSASTSPDPHVDAGGRSDGEVAELDAGPGPELDSGGVAALYGAVPVDGAFDEGDAPVPPYGAPAVDAGRDPDE